MTEFLPSIITGNMPFPNTGVLTGTLMVAGAPDTPVRRKMHVFESSSRYGMPFPTAVFVRNALSDVAGNWSVGQLDPSKKYGIIAYDHTGQYDPVIKINLTPSVP